MNINDIISSTDPIVANLGKRAQTIKEAYTTGHITEAEYDDLVCDLTTLQNIEDLSRRVHEKALLNDAIKFITNFLTKK
jgi:hypothetical protein